jgi:hypothetical protein
MRRKILSFIWPAAMMLALTGIPQAADAATDPKPGHGKKADPFLSGDPFTLDQVLTLLKQDAIPMRRRKEAIENRGIAFPLSSDALSKLESAGAPEEILDVIKSKAAKPAPVVVATPKVVAKGSLNLTCAPAECQVSLNGTSIGPTAGGALQAAGLTPGNWVVDFSKEGFVGNQSTVIVEPAKSATLAITLEPDRAAREAFGAHLFKKMLGAIGGEDGLKTLGSVQAVGSTTLWGRDGKSVRWTLLMRNRADRALFQARSGRLLHEVMFAGSEFSASKNLKGDEALELPTDFGLIRDYQLPALMARLGSAGFKLLADHAEPVAGQDFVLFPKAGTEKISIGLDTNFRPERVKITTAAGLGSAMITYADYVQNGNTFYPKTMQIKPDSQPQGIEVRFDTIELNPNLKDPDYKLRGKPFVDLGN